jgi:hypothetical protein
VSAVLAPPVSPGWLEPPEFTVLLALVLPPELVVLPPEMLPPGLSPVALPWEQDAATNAKPATKSIWRVVRFIYFLLGDMVRASLGRDPSDASLSLEERGSTYSDPHFGGLQTVYLRRSADG